MYSFAAGYDVGDLHAFCQSADALRVSMASAEKRHVFNNTVVDVDSYFAGAGSLGGVFEFHDFVMMNIFVRCKSREKFCNFGFSGVKPIWASWL